MEAKNEGGQDQGAAILMPVLQDTLTQAPPVIQMSAAKSSTEVVKEFP